jgi:hypothetical protein
MMVLVALLMAVVVLSGPVAEVLDLPSPVAEAKKKHKKKKKNRPRLPAFNVVQCPNSPDDNYFCEGTPGNDYLIGGPADRSPLGEFDEAYGKEGDDVYDSGHGGDNLTDESATSNDRYLFPSTGFGSRNGRPAGATVKDSGGSADVLDLGSYKSTNFGRSKSGDGLFLLGPAPRAIYIRDFFTTNSIDYFRFSDLTITADEIKSQFP